jgi:hypothetical protein
MPFSFVLDELPLTLLQRLSESIGGVFEFDVSFSLLPPPPQESGPPDYKVVGSRPYLVPGKLLLICQSLYQASAKAFSIVFIESLPIRPRYPAFITSGLRK